MLEVLLYGMSALDPSLIAGLSVILVLVTAALYRPPLAHPPVPMGC